MDKEAVVHNGILLSHKRKTFESVLMIWMNLEPIIGKGNGNPLLGIYPEEAKIERDTCTLMFIAALFTIARTWKQP